jgi:iron complex outermembrane recepter protein
MPYINEPRSEGDAHMLYRNAGLVLVALVLGSAPPTRAQETQASDSASANASDTEEPANKMQTVVVTGTLLPTQRDSVAIPIIPLDAQQLEQNGVTSNALEVLRKSIPAFAGRSNAGASNANNDNQRTGGGSQLQLRNLPTLVLLNGRRLAIDGVGGTNGRAFVDVDQIPTAAIERIDVLTDGASSTYGSDAIGGVVNFILKSDFHGVKAGGRYGGAEGGYRERSAYITAGTNLGSFNFTGTGSYSRSDPLYQNARSFTSPLLGKSANIPGVVAANGSSPGAILAPGLNSPSEVNPTGLAATASSVNQLIANGTYLATTPGAVSNAFDVSQYQTLLSAQRQRAFVGSMDGKLFDDRVQTFGDLLYSRNTNYLQWLPQFSSLTVPAGAPYNPLNGNFAGVTFDYLPNAKRFENTTDASRAVLGLRGDLGKNWDWETAVDFSQSDFEQNILNVIFKPNLLSAIAGGYDSSGNPVAGGAYSAVSGNLLPGGPRVIQPALDPFALAAGIDPATLANLYGTENIKARSRLVSWDAKVAGTLFALPGGDLGLAVGLAWRREELSGHADANGRVTDPVTHSTVGNAQLWIGGLNYDPFKAHRTVSAIFAETRIPVTSLQWGLPGLRTLDLTGAVRREKYSDTGNSTVPKVGFRWQPFDRQVTVRGTYSKSYSAPFLYSEYAPTSTRQVGTNVILGLFGPNYGGMPFNGEDGNNPNLKPATSVSRSIGVVLAPEIASGLTISADFSSINLYGYQGGIGLNNILGSVNTLGAASPFFNNLGVDGFVGTPGATQPFVHPGDLLAFITNPTTGKGDPGAANRLYAADQFRNLAVLQERSYTIDVRYVFPETRFGRFALSTNGMIFRSFNFQDAPGHPYIQYAGASNNAGATGNFGGTLPTYRFFTTVDWAYGGFDVTLDNTYAAATIDTGVNGNSTPPIPVGRYLTWDARVAYNWHLDQTRFGGDITAAVGVNNFTNEMPPLAPRAFVDNNADVATFSPLGRLVYVTLAVSF